MNTSEKEKNSTLLNSSDTDITYDTYIDDLSHYELTQTNNQMISAIRPLLKEMYKNGIDTFIEIGPGKTLSGFVKRMKFEKPINILNINSVKTLENVLTELSRKEND